MVTAASSTFASAVAQDLRYDVSISAVEDPDLAAALEASSVLTALEDEPVSGPAGLVRRTEADVERLRQALRSFGYYRGDVEARIGSAAPDDPAIEARLREAPAASVDVRLLVEPGPRYRVSALAIRDAESAGDLPVPIDRETLTLRVGDPAQARAVLDAETQIVQQLQELGYPFAEAADREAIVDHDTQTMELTYAIAPGPRAALGTVTIQGLERVDEDFVRGRVPFAPGEPYTPAALDELRTSLTETGVFNTIRVEPADQLAADGTLPVTVTVAERERRFIGFGADYSTSEGFGAQIYWGHRNLFGGAEQFRIEAEVARLGDNSVDEISYGLNMDFRKPDLIIPDQDLVADFAVVSENSDAFDRDAVTAGVGLEQEFSETLSGGAGLSFEFAQITDDGDTDEFVLVGVPLTLTLDTTDAPLDPTEGSRVDLTVTPFPKWLGSSRNLLIASAFATGYEDFGTDGETVLAGRVGVGSLWGENRANVPENRLFYAGGGGSVRGYEFQSVGPLDDDDEPLGGRSLFEASLELRYKLTETIGIVPFIDAGGVFESNVPDFSEDLQYAAGIGGRYYTGFGPLRLDIAVPLNPRGRDDAFAFYVSLGQAF